MEDERVVDAGGMYGPPEGFVRVRVDVQWDGRGFVGWQSQPDARSVQDTLHAAVERYAEAARPVAAGRTDAGVHALCMPTHVDVRLESLKVPSGRFAQALNAVLPRDVAVLAASVAPAGFHARFSCRSRSYVYRIVRSRQRLPLEEGRALRVPSALDLESMRAAAARLVGRHDFAAFATREERQTVREVLALDVVEVGAALEVRVTGESFLRHMVRALVGTLLLAGEGKLDADGVAWILARGERSLAGRNVLPHGLYFERAEYGPVGQA